GGHVLVDPGRDFLGGQLLRLVGRAEGGQDEDGGEREQDAQSHTRGSAPGVGSKTGRYLDERGGGGEQGHSRKWRRGPGGRGRAGRERPAWTNKHGKPCCSGGESSSGCLVFSPVYRACFCRPAVNGRPAPAPGADTSDCLRSPVRLIISPMISPDLPRPS